MNFWSLFRVITGTLIITITGIIVLIKWNKEIDSETNLDIRNLYSIAYYSFDICFDRA